MCLIVTRQGIPVHNYALCFVISFANCAHIIAVCLQTFLLDSFYIELSPPGSLLRLRIHVYQEGFCFYIFDKCFSTEQEQNQTKTFKFVCFSWKYIKKGLKFSELVTVEDLKSILKDQENATLG